MEHSTSCDLKAQTAPMRVTLQLCHGTQHKLRLKGADCSYASDIAKIPQDFPSCTCLVFTLEDCEDAGIHLSAALPTLARLQRLAQLHIRVKDSQASQPIVVAPVLGMVRLQLPGLQSLKLSVNASWGDSRLPWQALGRATQLTKLSVKFDAQVGYSASMEHLSALSSLRSLSSLSVDVNFMSVEQQYSWLQHMTSLTRLWLPLEAEHSGLASIGSCTNLRDLGLSVAGKPFLPEAVCAALAQLVQLTRLVLRTDDGGSNPHFLSALGALSQLESLSVDGLSPASLPALAGLSKLTELKGTWQAGGGSSADSEQLVCNGVVETHGAGPIPFAAIPKLHGCSQLATWEPTTLKALAGSCMQLEWLKMDAEFTGPSLGSRFPVRERTAAIQAMASLQHLQQLSFGLNDDVEVAALATIKQLTSIHAVVPAGSSCTAVGLQLLLLLRDLQCMTLSLHGLILSQQDAQSVLCGMQQLKSLHVMASREQIGVFRAAQEAAQAAGVAAPAQVKLEVLVE